MIKCPSCNTDNADGSRFCSTCGKKLEVNITCPECKAQVSFEAAFCPQCGAGLKGKSASKGVNMAGAVVAGDVAIDSSTHIGSVDASTTQHIVEGDVSIDASTTNYNASTIQIINQRITQSSVKCGKCGKTIEKSASVTCPNCGDTMCAEHMNRSYGLCSSCVSSALRMLKSQSFAAAQSYFEKALASGANDPDIHYYKAICLLGGKKAYLQQRPTIDAVMKSINTAIALKPKGIYYYFMAYIKYDYFERKYLNINPNYRMTLQMAVIKGVTIAEINELYSIMGVPRPSCL